MLHVSRQPVGMIGSLVILLTTWFVTGCSTVPVSGRTQLNIASDTEVTKLSIEQFEEIKSRSRLSRNRDHIAQVQRVSDRIIAQVNWWEVPLAEWEVIVIDNRRNINAFAMAGGKIGVYSGLLEAIENDDQLAFVLAHEIAHVTSKHVHERLSQQMVTQAGGTVLGVAAMGYGSLTLASLASLYDMSSGMANLSFDRGKEREADYIGLILMARAGYDPEEAIRVVNLVDEQASSGGRQAPPAWLSTHPSSGQRVQKLREAMPEALEIRSRVVDSQDDTKSWTEFEF